MLPKMLVDAFKLSPQRYHFQKTIFFLFLFLFFFALLKTSFGIAFSKSSFFSDLELCLYRQKHSKQREKNVFENTHVWMRSQKTNPQEEQGTNRLILSQVRSFGVIETTHILLWSTLKSYKSYRFGTMWLDTVHFSRAVSLWCLLFLLLD